MNRLAEINPNAGDETDEKATSWGDHIEKYTPVKQGLDTIAKNVTELKKLIAVEKKCPDPSKSKQNMAKMNQIMDQTTTASQQVKRTLDRIKRDDDDFVEDTRNSKTQMDVRKNLHNSHCREFHDIMQTYSTIVSEARKDIQDRTRRRLQTVLTKGELSEDQIEDLVDDPDTAEQVIKQAMGGNSVRALVQNVNQRHDQMRALERQVNEVYELFRDLAVLIDVQGETLDVIANNVDNARSHVQEANVELKKAEDYQKQARGWKCYMIVFLFVILLVTVIVVAGSGGFSNG